MLQAELKILGGKHQGKAIPLSTKKFLVGREQDCHLRPNSDLVSRHHCVFSIDDYAVRLRDLGSTNGTRVNGKPLHGEVTLKAGDQIGIGKLELELVIRQRSATESPVEVMAPEAQAPLLGLSSAELDLASTMGTVEIAPVEAGIGQVAGETSYELPTTFALPSEDTSTSLTADTAIIPTMPGGPVPVPGAYPGYPQMPVYPGQMPAYPGYPQQMGSPGQQMGYPGQQMGYPAQYPTGYPAMPGYPMQQMPYATGYPAAPAAPMPSPAAPAVADAGMAVKLPPPESTGVKAATPPPPAAPDAAGGAPKTEEKPSNTAADIIKSYMQRKR
jgi:pSer/pThr/pTyr-binding forkhead associated (FHA) protein